MEEAEHAFTTAERVTRTPTKVVTKPQAPMAPTKPNNSFIQRLICDPPNVTTISAINGVENGVEQPSTHDTIAVLKEVPTSGKATAKAKEENSEGPSMHGAFTMLQELKSELQKQTTKGEPLKVKERVLQGMDKLLQYLELGLKAEEEAESQMTRLANMEKDIKEIKQAVKEPLKTWAHVVQGTATTITENATLEQRQRELQEAKEHH